MKILKLLNKKNLSIFIINILLSTGALIAEEEPVDIWESIRDKNGKNVIKTSH